MSVSCLQVNVYETSAVLIWEWIEDIGSLYDSFPKAEQINEDLKLKSADSRGSKPGRTRINREKERGLGMLTTNQRYVIVAVGDKCVRYAEMLYSPDQEKQAVKAIVILKQVSKYFSVIHNNLCAKTFSKVCQDLVDILGTFIQAEPL